MKGKHKAVYPGTHIKNDVIIAALRKHCTMKCKLSVSSCSDAGVLGVSEGGRGGPVGSELLCVRASCSAASRLQPSQIQARPHSYLFHKLRSKCRCWQIRPGPGTASLRQLPSRNSPSMPCWGWGKELKDSWAGCVINSLHDWCLSWLIMSRFKRRQEKGKYFRTHHFLFILTLPETDRESAFCLSPRLHLPSTLVLWALQDLFGTWERRERWYHW